MSAKTETTTHNPDLEPSPEALYFEAVSEKLQALQFGSFRYRGARALVVDAEVDGEPKIYYLAPYGLSRDEERYRWAYKLIEGVRTEDDADVIDKHGEYQVESFGQLNPNKSFQRIVGSRAPGSNNPRKREVIEKDDPEYERIQKILETITDSDEYEEYMEEVEKEKERIHNKTSRRIGRAIMSKFRR